MAQTGKEAVRLTGRFARVAKNEYVRRLVPASSARATHGPPSSVNFPQPRALSPSEPITLVPEMALFLRRAGMAVGLGAALDRESLARLRHSPQHAPGLTRTGFGHQGAALRFYRRCGIAAAYRGRSFRRQISQADRADESRVSHRRRRLKRSKRLA